MKTARKLLLVIVVISLSLIGCSSGQTNSQAVEQGPILIGGTLCATGIQAYLDEPGIKGAQLAVEELNKKGGILGRQVEFVNIDGQSDPKLVEKAAEEMVKKNNIKLLTNVF